MTKQDRRRPYKVQPKSSLLTLPRAGTHYERLQDFVKPPKAISQGRESEAIPISTQWIGWSGRVVGSERCFRKITFRYNQCHSCNFGKD